MSSHDDEELAALNAAACPTVESLDVIGTQWRLNVIHCLLQADDGEKRFNDLKESTGASSRTLSQTLDALQEYGVVERRSEEAAPIAVYYSLTEKGEALEPVFDDLAEWADEWQEPTFDADPRA